jgi:hypothetical protein
MTQIGVTEVPDGQGVSSSGRVVVTRLVFDGHKHVGASVRLDGERIGHLSDSSASGHLFVNCARHGLTTWLQSVTWDDAATEIEKSVTKVAKL